MADPPLSAALESVKAWLALDHEGRVMTLVEDGSFAEYFLPVVAAAHQAESLRAERPVISTQEQLDMLRETFESRWRQRIEVLEAEVSRLTAERDAAEARHSAAHVNWGTAEKLAASHMDTIERLEAEVARLRAELAGAREDGVHWHKGLVTHIQRGLQWEAEVSRLTAERDAVLAETEAATGMVPGGDTPTLECIVHAIREQRGEVARLRAALTWALGEGDDFPVRQDGQGQYWWRSELRRRAALQAPTP